MVYNDSGGTYFVRALDAGGKQWGKPVKLCDAADEATLAIIHGNPAVAVRRYDVFSFVRALDSDGTAWGTPVDLARIPEELNSYPGDSYLSLADIDGRPALAYFDSWNADLQFISSFTTDGSFWNASQTIISAGDVGRWPSLLDVQGRPAVTYFDATRQALRFVRGADALGHEWNAPQTIDFNGGSYSTLAIIAGRPAACCYDYDAQQLRYVQAADAIGSSWNQPQVVATYAPNVTEYYNPPSRPSMTTLGNDQAIAYFDLADNAIYVARCTAETWQSPQLIYKSPDQNWRWMPQLVTIQSQLAMSFLGPNYQVNYYSGF